MTICVSVRVAEGLVMAADSVVMLSGEVPTPNGVQRQMLQTFDYATKVARVKDYPMGVMTWGLGSISARSIQSLVMEFEYGYKGASQAAFSIRTVADDLLKFIVERYDAAYPAATGEQTLGLFVGGYSAGEFFSTQFTCELPGQRSWQVVRPDRPDGSPDFGANWYGLTDALQRLFLGFDPAALQRLVDRGVDATVIQSWIDSGEAALPLVFDGMPIQDAVDFAQYAADMTIGRWRFGPGAPLVGGAVDIAVIRPGTFAWAKRKAWSIKD